MRTTITLDKDVARRLKATTAQTGRSFKHVVNDALRAGLDELQKPRAAKPFHVRPLKMGLRPGLDLDNIGEVLARVEGENHR